MSVCGAGKGMSLANGLGAAFIIHSKNTAFEIDVHHLKESGPNIF